MRKSQFHIHTILSFFSGVCIIAAFSLLFCVQTFTTHDCFETDSTYISGTFNDDIAPVFRNTRENDFSINDDLASGGSFAECLPQDGCVDQQISLTNHKNQTSKLNSNFSCEFIACVAPPRAGPRCL